MDRNVCGDGRAASGQGLKDQGRVEPREAAAAEIFAHIDAAHAERSGLAQHIDGKVLFLIPFNRFRRQLLLGETTGHLNDGLLLRVQRKHPIGDWQTELVHLVSKLLRGGANGVGKPA